MTDRSDPNIPADPTDPTVACIEGDITSVVVTELPTIGRTNLVVSPDKPFDIKVSWRIFGNLVPVWVTALSVNTPNWIVTAYAESEGPGEEKLLGKTDVAVSSTPLSLNMPYNATITVPAGTLHEENPGDPYHSGIYKIVVTAFLNSTLGLPGYDMMGYAEGPIIKVENPE